MSEEADEVDEGDEWSAALDRFGPRVDVDEARRTASGSLRRAAIAAPVGVVLVAAGLLVGGIARILTGIGAIVALVGLTALATGVGWQVAVTKQAGMVADDAPSAPTGTEPPAGPACDHEPTGEWLRQLARRRARVAAIGLAVAIVPAGVLSAALAIADPHSAGDGVVALIVVAALPFAAGLGTVLGVGIRTVVDRPVRQLLASRPWTRIVVPGLTTIVVTGTNRYTSIAAIGLLRIGDRVVLANRFPLGRPRRGWFPVPPDGRPAAIWLVESEDGRRTVVARPGGVPPLRTRSVVDERSSAAADGVTSA